MYLIQETKNSFGFSAAKRRSSSKYSQNLLDHVAAAILKKISCEVCMDRDHFAGYTRL